MGVNIAELLSKPLPQAIAERYKANFPTDQGTDPQHIEAAAQAYSRAATPKFVNIKASRTTIEEIRAANDLGIDTDGHLIDAAELAHGQGRTKIGPFGNIGRAIFNPLRREVEERRRIVFLSKQGRK